MAQYCLSQGFGGAANVTYGENSIIVPIHELPVGDPAALDVYITAAVATNVRTERSARLASCDYLMMLDYPLSETQLQSWVAYRQALRDISKQPGFPFHVEWPKEP